MSASIDLRGAYDAYLTGHAAALSGCAVRPEEIAQFCSTTEQSTAFALGVLHGVQTRTDFVHTTFCSRATLEQLVEKSLAADVTASS